MAYIGRSPTPGEVIQLNSLESQFNGVLTTFNLTRTTGGVTSDFYPVSSGHLLVSLGGVIQEPDPTGDTGFRINYNTIIFAIAPLAGTSCFIISYGNILDIGTPADQTVTPIKLSTGGPTWNSAGNLTVSGDLNVTGSLNSGTQGLFWEDNEPANFGNSNDLKIYHNGTDNYFDSITTGQKVFFRTSNSTSLDTNALSILSNGNVGIGTTNPTTKLQVQSGGISVKGAASPNINFEPAGILGNADISFDGTTFNLVSNSSSASLVLSTFSTERFRITSTGNVGIGTTNPATKLDVNGNIFPTTDATHDLGSSTKRWANIYSADLQLSNEGSSNDVDGTWGAYTIQEGENDLYLLNRRNGKKYKFVLQEVN